MLPQAARLDDHCWETQAVLAGIFLLPTGWRLIAKNELSSCKLQLWDPGTVPVVAVLIKTFHIHGGDKTAQALRGGGTARQSDSVQGSKRSLVGKLLLGNDGSGRGGSPFGNYD